MLTAARIGGAVELLQGAGVIVAIGSSVWAVVYSVITRRGAKRDSLNTLIHAQVAVLIAAVDVERRTALRLAQAIKSSAARRSVVDLGQRLEEAGEDVSGKLAGANFYIGANAWSKASALMSTFAETREQSHSLIAKAHNEYLELCRAELRKRESMAPDKRTRLTLHANADSYGADVDPALFASVQRAEIGFDVEVVEAFNTIIRKVREDHPMPGTVRGNSSGFTTSAAFLPSAGPQRTS